VKIFFFSTVFHPSVGGVETVVETLCREFVRAGHEVRLATLTPGPSETDYPFEINRQPGLRRFLRLLRWADVHMQANVSLKYCWPLMIAPRRAIYGHHCFYQKDDGSFSMLARLKRLVARSSNGIANSHYTAARLKCHYTVLNPYNDEIFQTTVSWHERPGDLVFLGRLVSQKGCDVLFRALGLLAAEELRPRLTVIGDGPERVDLANLAHFFGIEDQVCFVGILKDEALAVELNRHRFIVVPSVIEEPFGVVALEGLACGCLPIVSENGGLVDAIGPHGLTVPNGDPVALAARLREALSAPEGAAALLEGSRQHLEQFRAENVAARYLEIFEQALLR
jgi:glycogen synthase